MLISHCLTGETSLPIAADWSTAVNTERWATSRSRCTKGLSWSSYPVGTSRLYLIISISLSDHFCSGQQHKWWSVYLYHRLCLSTYLSIHLSVHPFVWLVETSRFLQWNSRIRGIWQATTTTTSSGTAKLSFGKSNRSEEQLKQQPWWSMSQHKGRHRHRLVCCRTLSIAACCNAHAVFMRLQHLHSILIRTLLLPLPIASLQPWLGTSFFKCAHTTQRWLRADEALLVTSWCRIEQK